MRNSSDSTTKSRPRKLAKLDEPLEAVLTRLGIPDDWDFLLVGDGSGSNWANEAGFACVSIERTTMERQVWYGAFNRGTVNVAEIMAYMQPLNWLAAREEERRQEQKTKRRAWRIHILTDSQYCQKTGSTNGHLTVNKNAVLWSALDVFSRQGFVLHWHWIKREDVGLNLFVDEVSRLARKRLKSYNLLDRVGLEDGADGQARTADEVNPSGKVER